MRELTLANLEILSSERHIAGTFLSNATDSKEVVSVAFFEDASVEDVELSGCGLRRLEELLAENQVIVGHVPGEVCRDASLFREVELRVGSIIGVDFAMHCLGQIRESPLHDGAPFAGLRVRLQNSPELLRRQLGDELHAAEVVVIACVAVEACSIGNKFFPFVLCEARDLAHSSLLEAIKVFLGKVGLEEAEEEGRLVGDLV